MINTRLFWDAGIYDNRYILKEAALHDYIESIVTVWPSGRNAGFSGDPHAWENRIIDLMDLRRLRR